jgi:ribose 5-phosphate isomerase B
MKLAVAADEYHHVVGVVLRELEKMGHSPVYYGPNPEDPPGQPQHYWPVVARLVAEEVAAGNADEGILFCWTGTGVSLAANKVRGVRAALCVDAETARVARLWNNANILCL